MWYVSREDVLPSLALGPVKEEGAEEKWVSSAMLNKRQAPKNKVEILFLEP